MAETDPRRLAADVLLAVDDGQWSDEALARALDAARLGDADRALATRLVYGTLARRRSVDHTIEAWAARPLAKIDPMVLTALRLGLFQMEFLDRVPDHAAVMTSVELVARRAASAKGFVNALLRRAQREGLVPPPDSPDITHLGVMNSHPDWLVEMWVDELGRDEAEALMEANNEAAPTCYRALDDRDAALKALAVVGIQAEAGRHAASSIVIAGPVHRLDGLAVVQGESSQLVVEMLDPQPGERVLDACASPGGKTAAIAARVMRGQVPISSKSVPVPELPTGGKSVPVPDLVMACDPAPRAGERVRASLVNAGIGEGVTFHECAVESLAAGAGTFDAVLADAPCSGLGTLRQHPEIRWRRSPADLEDLAGRQRAILAAAARLVKPGGRLVYSTCTIARLENDDVVESFLADHPEFSRTPRSELPPGVAALCEEDGTLRTFPHRDDIDGFFAVRMQHSLDDTPTRKPRP